jgi:helicase MOV-10
MKTFKTELGAVILLSDPNHTQLLDIVPNQCAIDFEWRPGKESEIAMIQIAYFDAKQLQYICFLFRNWDQKKMKQFLRNPKKGKIIASKVNSRAMDFRKLALTFKTEFYDGCGFLSLQTLAEKKGLPIGLGNLCATFDFEYLELDFRLHHKWDSVWTEDEEKVMVRYAAHDAILAHLLWLRLQLVPDLKKNTEVYPCRVMMKTGSCTKVNCQYSHSLITCDKCNVVCTSEQGWKNHVNGRKHQETLESMGETYRSEFYCSDCNRNFNTSKALKYHLGSLEHKKTLNVMKFVEKKVQSQSDKEGFSVSAESVFDLGVLPTLSTVTPLHFVIESKHSLDGFLLQFVFTSKDSDCVELVPVRTPQCPLKLPSKSQATIKFNCKAKKWGYFQSEMQFHFQRQSKVFVITRTVKGFVGDRDLFENLMPKTEYVRKQRSATVVADEEEFIGAGHVPELVADVKKYVRPLNVYPVPHKLRQLIYAPASAREMPAHEEFVQEFLPKDYGPLGSYSMHYSHLLWAEEAQLEIDIKQFTMLRTDVISQSGGRSFLISVPGLAEGRPSILIGDSILVKKSDTPNSRAFEGRAVDVRLNEVVLKFHEKFKKSYIKGQKYDVQFRYNRNPWRRMQLAVATTSEQFTGLDTIYRGKEAEKKTKMAVEGLKIANEYKWKPFNRMLFDNPEQRKAISIILNDLFMPFPFLIHGPPVTAINFRVLGKLSP